MRGESRHGGLLRLHGPGHRRRKGQASQEEGFGWGRRGGTRIAPQRSRATAPAASSSQAREPRDPRPPRHAGRSPCGGHPYCSDLSWNRAELLERGAEGRRAKLSVAGAALEPQLPV